MTVIVMVMVTDARLVGTMDRSTIWLVSSLVWFHGWLYSRLVGTMDRSTIWLVSYGWLDGRMVGTMVCMSHLRIPICRPRLWKTGCDVFSESDDQ